MFVDMYAEMAVTKGLSQRCQEVGLQVLLQDPHYHLFVIYTPEGKPLAAHIDHVYGQWGYHIMSANSNLARELKGTTHLLMENVFEWMKIMGFVFMIWVGLVREEKIQTVCMSLKSIPEEILYSIMENGFMSERGGLNIYWLIL